MAKHAEEEPEGSRQQLKWLRNYYTLGVPLLREETPEIWAEQKHHVRCLHNVLLYTITGHLRKGSVDLPIYRSARRSTSLESFHMHLVRFIPDTSANEVNFQAYLLDGITRWNHQRYCSSFESLHGDQLRTFNMSLQARAHSLYMVPRSVVSSYKPPSTYTCSASSTCSLSLDRASTLTC